MRTDKRERGDAAALLGADDGPVDFTSVIGTFGRPTDANDAIGTSAVVPAPGSAMLRCVGLLAGGRRGGR